MASRFQAVRVLDVACGAGIGFDLLAAALIVGGDLDPVALDEAASGAGRVSLCRLDVAALPFRDQAFDLITCFETIEHVEDDAALVGELHRVVSATGVALISTPVRGFGDPDGERSENPFHLREYLADELLALLRPSFRSVELLGQAPRASYERNGFWSPAMDPWTRTRRLALKVARRLPATARQGLERVRRQSLFPGAEDFDFRADRVDCAPVLVAVCRR